MLVFISGIANDLGNCRKKRNNVVNTKLLLLRMDYDIFQREFKSCSGFLSFFLISVQMIIQKLIDPALLVVGEPGAGLANRQQHPQVLDVLVRSL